MRSQHIAAVWRDEDTKRFGGRCSCGEPLGTEWYELRSPFITWADHLKQLDKEYNA